MVLCEQIHCTILHLRIGYFHTQYILRFVDQTLKLQEVINNLSFFVCVSLGRLSTVRKHFFSLNL